MPEHLELIATLDYSYREVKSMVGKKPPKKKVIERFRKFKRERFGSKEISETYDRLAGVGLFDSPIA